MNNRIPYQAQQLRSTLTSFTSSNLTPYKTTPKTIQNLYQHYYPKQNHHNQNHNQFKNIKKITQQVADLRHTMNYKVIQRVSQQNKYLQQQDKHSKFNEFFKQTNNYKNTKAKNLKYTLDTMNSQQVYFKNETTEQSNRYRPYMQKRIGEGKSLSNFLQSSSSIREYQKLSQKIERNKKMIEQLRKNKEEGNYLKNVALKKVPNYIVDEQRQRQRQIQQQKIFKKKKQYYFTPKQDKNNYQSRFNSSPLIQIQPFSPSQYNHNNNKKKINTQFNNSCSMVNSLSTIIIPSIHHINHKNNSHHDDDSSSNNLIPPPPSSSLKKKTSILSPKVNQNNKQIIQNQLEQYQIGKKLGQGKFGIVNIIKHKKSHGIFAMKKISKTIIKSNMMIDQLALQIRLQSCLHHSNILSMYGFFDDKTHLFIILQYMDGGTLYHKLKKQIKLCQKQTSYIIKQMTQAIEYLHDLGIAHRDIKPQNIVRSNNIYKLCDFGWAAMCNQRRKTYCGTFDYVAPEILQGVDYDMTVDLWCLGVMTYQLLTGKAPFYHISRKQTMKKILNVDTIDYPNQMSQKAKDFIDKLIRKNPNDRITAHDALSHPFIKNAEWDG